MKRVLVIASHAWYPDKIGGGYKIATDFAKFCAKEGEAVHFICMSNSKRWSKTERSGVSVWSYPKPPASGRSRNPLNLIAHHLASKEAMRRIAAQTGKEAFYVINGHEPLPYGGALAAAKQLSLSYRSAMSVHSPLALEFEAQHPRGSLLIKKTISFIFRKIEQKCIRNSNVVQCDSDFTKSLIARNLSLSDQKRLTVCPGYVSEDIFLAAGLSKSAARSRLGPPWDGPGKHFFTLRRHVERMGIDNLIQAFASLEENGATRSKNAPRLIIGGEGPLTPALKKLAAKLDPSNRIFFTGSIPQENVPLCYRAADCFILPTRNLECFGLIILEAFASGTPVIATPVGSIPEVLGPYAAECLTAGTAPNDLRKSISAFLREPPSEAVTQGLRDYAMHFEAASILKRLKTVVCGD